MNENHWIVRQFMYVVRQTRIDGSSLSSAAKSRLPSVVMERRKQGRRRRSLRALDFLSQPEETQGPAAVLLVTAEYFGISRESRANKLPPSLHKLAGIVDKKLLAAQQPLNFTDMMLVDYINGYRCD